MLPSMLHTVCAFFVILFHYFINLVRVNAELDKSMLDGWKEDVSTIISVPVEVCSANVMNGSFVFRAALIK